MYIYNYGLKEGGGNSTFFTAGTNSCNWTSITRLLLAQKKIYELRWHLFDATFVTIEEN